MDSEQSQKEILIVGGGPVGLLTALILAEKSYSVTVCERKSFPVDKACGEGILPAGVSILTKLGLVPDTFSKISGLSFQSFGKKASIEFKSLALGVKRLDLSRRLYERCTENEVQFFEQTRFRLVEHQDQKSIVTFLSADGKLFKKNYDYVIGCDGIHSKVARIHDAVLRKLPFSQRSGMRRHFRGLPWTRHVEIHFFDGGEAYVTPVGPSEIQVAVLAFRGRYRAFDDVIEHLPELKLKLRSFTPADDHLAHGPLGWLVKNPIQSTYAVLGDAFCFWDGISGEGLSLGFKEAFLFAQHFALPMTIEAQKDLNKKLSRLIRPYLILTLMLLLISRVPLLRSFILSIWTRFPHFGNKIGHKLIQYGNGG